MWLCEAKPQESVIKIGQRLKGRLGIEEKVTLHCMLLLRIHILKMCSPVLGIQIH